MFDSQEDIYQFVGGILFENQPKKWVVAWIDVNIHIFTKKSSFSLQYLESSDDDNGHDLELENQLELFNIHDAFNALYQLMKTDADDVPWNRCRFVVHPDGDLEVDFKIDPDLNWLNSLDPDKDTYPSYDVIQALESWDGLSENADRPWLDPEGAMYKGK